MDQTARLWDGSGSPIAVLGRAYGLGGPRPSSAPTATRLVTASTDATLRLWNARTGELIAVLRGHGGRLYYPPVFTPDGSRLVSTRRGWHGAHLGPGSGGAKLGSARARELCLRRGFQPRRRAGGILAWDGTTRLWDATSGRQTGLLKHEKSIVGSVTFSRDGQRLVTVERDHGITLWDVASQKVARTWMTATGYWGADPRAALDSSGTLLACGCAQGPIRLWDMVDGHEIAQLTGHDGCSIDVAFAPDGQPARFRRARPQRPSLGHRRTHLRCGPVRA